MARILNHAWPHEFVRTPRGQVVCLWCERDQDYIEANGPNSGTLAYGDPCENRRQRLIALRKERFGR